MTKVFLRFLVFDLLFATLFLYCFLNHNFSEEFAQMGTSDLFVTLPATLLVTLGGAITNIVYCLYQNARNKSFGDYTKGSVWANNLVFCALAGLLWYSQFFGLAVGKTFLASSPAMLAFAWSILMSLNVIFSNVWGLILKEWRGVNTKTIVTLLSGLAILIFSLIFPSLFN